MSAARRKAPTNLLGGPLHRPVNRIELGGAILAVVLLQTFILLLIYPTGDNEKLEKRLAATEIWAQSAAARNEFALDLDKRIAKLEKKLKAMEEADAEVGGK